tara:strand:- start:45523 stop:47835 length:2313 start_codon:yes stop_codon:yes gene_type:complete
MKYLVTDREAGYAKRFKDYVVITSSEAFKYSQAFIDNNPTIGFDIETTGLDAWVNKPILYTLGTEETQFVFEHFYCHKKNLQAIFNYLLDKNTRLLGHNIKFDLKFVLTNEGVKLTNVYDTMIAEQRLWQKLGLRMSLAHLNSRYRNVEVESMDKTIRMEFVGANPQYFRLEERHLQYALDDITPLFEIKAKQDKKTYEKGLYNLIYKVEMPLVSIVAQAEVEGFDFNIEKWRSIYEANIEKKFNTEIKLDEEFRRLRQYAKDHGKLDSRDLLGCSGGKYDHKRIKSHLLDTFELDGTPKSLDLFGDTSTRKALTNRKSKINFYPNNINYGSDAQIIEIFGHIKEPLMTKQGHYEYPQFNKKGKINKVHYSYLTNEDSLVQRKIDYPNDEVNTFIDLVLEHRKLNTRINNFGVNYESKINSVTGKLHTSFRQCAAVTGRFQSGGGRYEPDKPNFQNIPADKEMRSCFIAPDNYSIITADYSGAELIVMCSLSQDMDLLEMSKRDMHSEIATKCWKAVYEERVKEFRKLKSKGSGVWSHQELDEFISINLDLAENFVVNKSPDKIHLRTAFKPITFGVIYGLRKKGLSKYLSISEEEAQVIINLLKRTFPKVFAMVQRCSDFAERNGYLVLNSRTKSRVYFPNIIKELKGEYHRDIHFREIMEDVNEARNIPIQGTQADFIKEASVQFQKYIDTFKIDAVILSWIHDEIVTKCHNRYIENKNLTYTFKGKTTENLNLAEVKRLIMNDTANQYLNNVTIDTDYDVAPHWVKG